MVVAELLFRLRRHSHTYRPNPSPHVDQQTVRGLVVPVRVLAALRVLLLGGRPLRAVLRYCLPKYQRRHLATAPQLLQGLVELLLSADQDP